MFRLKRAYEPPAPTDGVRVLVDRKWPCRVWKREANIDLWLQDIAPSEALFDWYHRDPAKWDAFREQYWEELRHKPALVDDLLQQAEHGTVTLVYRMKDTAHSNALALLQYLEWQQKLRDWRQAA